MGAPVDQIRILGKSARLFFLWSNFFFLVQLFFFIWPSWDAVSVHFKIFFLMALFNHGRQPHCCLKYSSLHYKKAFTLKRHLPIMRRPCSGLSSITVEQWGSAAGRLGMLAQQACLAWVKSIFLFCPYQTWKGNTFIFLHSILAGYFQYTQKKNF